LYAVSVRRPALSACTHRQAFSSSLPSPGQLPFRSWLQVVVLYHVTMTSPPAGDLHPIYNAPILGAHNGTDAFHCGSCRTFGEWTEGKRNGIVLGEVNDYGQHIYGGNEAGWRLVDRMD
jgi:hypothetical protein